jgi:MSHA biogenesis protein MshM
MYYGHFGLDQPPFKMTPNTEFFFGGGNRGAILEALIYAVTEGEGLVKVTGEVGSGKTMLCNMLQARLPPNVETVYLAHPNVPPEEILHAIAFELQLGLAPGASRLEVTHALQNFLLKRHAEGRRVVVFVEESQSMPLATLEEMRLLSNLETRNDKLLQIVLFGQPELDDNLGEPAIRQLRERITHSFRLEPLTAAEIHEYLMFRMRTAGYRGPDLFSTSVVRRIARASEGLTRRVNLIADKALLAAFSENTHTIRARHVDAAVRDSEFSRRARSWSVAPFATGAVLALALIVFGAGAYLFLAAPGGTRLDRSATGKPVASGAPAGADTPITAEAARGTAGAETETTGAGSAPASGTGAITPSPVTSVPSPAPAANTGMDPRHGVTSGNLVEQRLAATRHWLASVDPGAFTIQLMETEHEPQLLLELNVLSKSIEINKVFLYRTEASRKVSLSVLYGSFSDRAAAQDALDKLPLSLKANWPFLRTVRTVRAVRNDVGQPRSPHAFGASAGQPSGG